MFGLSMREMLSKSIINASENCISIYKESILNNLKALDELNNEEDVSILLASIRKKYLDAVTNSVISSFQISSPTVFSKIQLLLMSPAACGYEGISIDNGIMAGSLFAICYYALKNKVASPAECIKLNHIQNSILDKALMEIDSEL